MNGQPVNPSAGEPLVGVHALRTFRVSEDGHLVPVTMSSHDWRGGVAIARCNYHTKHVPPIEDCTCGIYSFKDQTRLLEEGSQLIAVIALEGQAIEGERGWRAQAARVVALWLEDGALPGEVETLLRANLCGVRFYDRREDMIAAYPDLTRGPDAPDPTLSPPAAENQPAEFDGPIGGLLAVARAFSRLINPWRAAGFLAPWMLFTGVYGLSYTAPPELGMPVPMRAWAIAAIAISVAAGAWFTAGQLLRCNWGSHPDRHWRRLLVPRLGFALGVWLYWQAVGALTIGLIAVYHQPAGHTARYAASLGYGIVWVIGMLGWAFRHDHPWPRLPRVPTGHWLLPYRYSELTYPLLVRGLDPAAVPAAPARRPRALALQPGVKPGQHRAH